MGQKQRDEPPQSGETHSKCGYEKEFISFLSTLVITTIMPVSQVVVGGGRKGVGGPPSESSEFSTDSS